MIKTSKNYGKLSTVPLETLIKDHNHRLRQNEQKLSHILEGDNPLAEHGLTTPIVVLPLENGKHEIVRGHTRNEALKMLLKTNPEAFQKHFAKGIPVEILPPGLSAAEIESIRQDQGESQDLSHRAEFITAAVERMRRGDTEHKVIESLIRYFIRFGQANEEKDAEYDKLVLAGETKAARDQAHTRFHGAYQKIARFFTLPPFFLIMLRAFAEQRNLDAHEIPAWYPEKSGDLSSFIPVWRDKYSKSLDDKWRNEQKVMDSTGLLPKYNRNNPGPEFIAYCESLIQEIKDSAGKESTKVIADKSLSSKVLQDLAKECGSRLLKDILLYAAGKQVPGFDLLKADELIQQAEAVQNDTRNVGKLLVDLQDLTENDVNELTLEQLGWLVKESLKQIMQPAS